MQPFWVPARGGGAELELDRCSDCGGVWFDAGEVERATGKRVSASGGATRRACPRCKRALSEATLGARIAVEACGTCRGVFLEARDVDALARSSSAKAPPGTGFVCEGCGQRRPFSEAQPTLTGLVCGACATPDAPPVEEKPAASRSVFSRFVGWLSGE